MNHPVNRILTPSLPTATGGVRCALSTRVAGNSLSPFGMNTSFSVGDDAGNVTASRQELLASIGSTPDRLALPVQVHGTVVLRVDAPGNYPHCDGLVTSNPEICLGVSTADCVPVFIFDPVQRVIAAVHAGWRGTAGGIAAQAIATLKKEYGSSPADLLGYIGPCADVCCYEVGDDVAAKFDDRFVAHRPGSLRLNLKQANVAALIQAGLLPARIEVSPHCTISEPDLFHSYRRDKERSGRMMGVIRLIR